MIDPNLKDEFGGIDENIKTAVYNFDSAGLITTGSCEGHADKSSPVPWIHVVAKDEPSVSAGTEEATKWKKKNEELRAKIDTVIEEFYNDRNVPEDLRVATLSGNWGFWIFCDKDAFAKWRYEVDVVVVQKEKGEPHAKHSFSESEKAERAEKLPLYYQGMDAFSEFLKKRGI